VRRGLGRGRILIAIGAVLGICSMPLPWLKVGGVVLAARTANGFEGSGVLVFLASAAMLVVIVLPYASRSGSSPLDRPLVYLALLVVGLAGLSSEALRLLGTEGSSMAPSDAPGLWLAMAGMAVTTWGVLECFAERPSPP